MNHLVHLYQYLTQHWTWLQSVVAGSGVIVFIETVKRNLPAKAQARINGAAKAVGAFATSFAVAALHVELTLQALNTHDLSTLGAQGTVVFGSAVAIYEVFAKKWFTVLDKSKQFDALAKDAEKIVPQLPAIAGEAAKAGGIVANDSAMI